MLKMNDTSSGGGRLSQGRLQLRVETDEEDCNDTSAGLLPEVDFNARDEFNLKFFDNADENCFSDSESVESCEVSTSSPTDVDPSAPIDDIESQGDWMDNLMQTIDGTEGFGQRKSKIATNHGLAQNNNNEGEDIDKVLSGIDERPSDIFANVIKIGKC